MKRGLKTCTTLRAAIIACVIFAALLALTSANILFPGLSLAVFVLSSMPVLLMMIGLIAGLIPMFFCLLTALCDETVKIFIAGRVAQISDIWLDFAGAMAGILLMWLISAIKRR